MLADNIISFLILLKSLQIFRYHAYI